MTKNLTLVLTLAYAVGCASATGAGTRADVAMVVPQPEPRVDVPCATCDALSLGSDVTVAIEKRLADLKARGGLCSSIGAVLESSYRSGQITIRPFMWRVGAQLASGQARPNGDMILAREIDPLNVGVRTLDDLLWTMEHEAAHIAFKIDNMPSEDHADDYVRTCRSSAVPVDLTR